MNLNEDLSVRIVEFELSVAEMKSQMQSLQESLFIYTEMLCISLCGLRAWPSDLSQNRIFAELIGFDPFTL